MGTCPRLLIFSPNLEFLLRMALGAGCVFYICVCEKNGLLRNNNMVYVLSFGGNERKV